MGLDVTGQYRYPPPKPDWLALREEDVLERDLPIVDAHHHLWSQDGHPYLIDEICADVSSGHNVIATVFVEAHYGYHMRGPSHLAPVGETEKVAEIAKAARARPDSPQIAAAIVAHADLCRGSEVEEIINAHLFAANGALRGIRHSVSRDPLFPNGIVIRPAPAGLLADSQYRRGLKKLSDFGLSYDAMLYSTQIPELSAVANAIPGLPIILDHIGCIIGVGPRQGHETESFKQWQMHMAELAHNENVSVKIGGFGMIVCGARWHERETPPGSQELAKAWRPYFETCLELFGAERCMFESNFPVDKAMYSYRTLWNAFKRLASGASVDEKRALFGGTAARAYKLDLPNLVQMEDQEVQYG